MGQGEINPSLKKVTNLSPSNFLFLNVIGKGGVGKVWKVQALKPKMILAMKQMSKSKIVSKKIGKICKHSCFYRHCNHFASVLCRFRKIFRTFA